jgi:hypothetical protein
MRGRRRDTREYPKTNPTVSPFGTQKNFSDICVIGSITLQ